VDEAEINSIATEVVELVRQRLRAKGFELDSDQMADLLTESYDFIDQAVNE
jgi:hypothetical protein